MALASLRQVPSLLMLDIYSNSKIRRVHCISLRLGKQQLLNIFKQQLLIYPSFNPLLFRSPLLENATAGWILNQENSQSFEGLFSLQLYVFSLVSSLHNILKSIPQGNILVRKTSHGHLHLSRVLLLLALLLLLVLLLLLPLLTLPIMLLVFLLTPLLSVIIWVNQRSNPHYKQELKQSSWILPILIRAKETNNPIQKQNLISSPALPPSS